MNKKDIIKDIKIDIERAFYHSLDTSFYDITIDGAMDGESAFKECQNIDIYKSTFNLRYPCWHDNDLRIEDCNFSINCRAPFWYDKNISFYNVNCQGIKAIRECQNVTILNSSFSSDEICWRSRDIKIKDSKIQSVYAFLMCQNVELENVNFVGKYSFQYVDNLKIINSNLDTKDAFWHANNVVVENCVVKGEYLAWYSNNITFIKCLIIGTQPICYAKNIMFIDCKFEQCDLAFEYSDVNGNIIGNIESIKNPLSGHLIMDNKPNLIFDENDKSEGKFVLEIKK